MRERRRERLLQDADELAAAAEPLPPSAADVAIRLAAARLAKVSECPLMHQAA